MACAFIPPARAQTDWSAVSSGTAHNLWGVCHGGGLFVAVGEGGTVLTSRDGLAWTPRASGTTVWLTSVAYARGQYVAVGADGVVLFSPDGIAWGRIETGSYNPVRERLNVVRFADGEFMIYGERDTALSFRFPMWINSVGRNVDRPGTWWRGFATGLGRYVVGGEGGISVLEPADRFHPSPGLETGPVGIRNVSGIVFDGEAFVAVGAAGAIVRSSDAKQWAALDSGTTSDLHGITTLNHTLIAVGSNGTILSVDELGRWRRRNAPTSELLLDVAASDGVAIAVGGAGTILRTSATPMAPVIFDAPVSVTEMSGGAAAFSVGVRGSLPLAYQWSHDGAPLPGETHATLIRAPLAPADAGRYTVTVRNSAGAATSAPAMLNVFPAAAPVVDSTFNADLALDGSPTALLPLPDGSVLVANGRPNQLVKLRPDGRLDPAWAENRFRGFDPYADQPSFNILVLQPDGRILVGGNFATHNGARRQNLLRLLPDGSQDDTFDPAAEPARGAVYDLSVQSDGRILVAGEQVTPIRLLADGRLDASFRMPPLLPATTSIPGVLRDYYARAVQPAADGKIVVASVANLQTAMHEWGRTASMVVRVHADGSRDETFSPIRWSGRVNAMHVLDDGGLLLLPQIAITTGFTQFQGRAWRFANDGSAFPGYLQPEIPAYSTSFIYSDGRVLYSAYRQTSPIRLTAVGAVDPTFTGGIGTATAIAAMADDHVLVAGSFDVYHGTRANRVARLNSRPNDALNPPRVLSVTADKTTVAYGERVTIRAAVVGSGPLTYEWSGVAGAFPDGRRTTSPVLEFSFLSPGYNPGLRLIVRNSRGEATSAPLAFTVVPAAPVVLAQPTRISAQTGRHVTLRVEKNPTAGDTGVEWRRDGRLLPRPGEPWADGQTLEFSHVTAADAGTYTLTLRNTLGETVTSAPIVLTVDDSSRLANLSTRAFVGDGQQTLIAGFTIAGSQAAPPRHVLIRAIGPGLARFGVTNFLPDPQLQVFDRSGRARVGAFADDWNDDWRDDFERVGAFPIESGSKDAATSVTVGAGSYTVHLTGKPGESGVALVEIYEDDNEADRMLNLSTRAFVAPGFPAIAGLGVRGPVPKKMLLRAVGPTLAGFGVGQPLSNSRLDLRDERGITVALNDDWEANSNLGELRAAVTAVGAFPLPAGSRDSALLVTLPPGNYTAIVESGANESGVVLIEAYEVQ